MGTKYFIDTQGNDDRNSFLRALKFANSIAVKDSTITRIVLYLHTKKNTDWFNGILNENTVKSLFVGQKFPDFQVPIKIETIKTYSEYSNFVDIVICFGFDTKDLCKLEDYRSARYIIAIPWVKSFTEEWIRTRNAINIDTNTSTTIAEPTEPVKKALSDLTTGINMSTGISHPMDNELAKTYIRALHKYEQVIDSSIVEAYLVNSLKWETRYAQEIKKLIDTLNEGRTFKGGAKTGLQNYYKHWKK